MLLRFFLCLTWIASTALAEESWTAPDLEPDNPVLVAGQQHNKELRMDVFGVSGPKGDGRLSHQAPSDFWQAVLDEDHEGLIDYSGISNDYGLMVLPSISVWFPTDDGVAHIKESRDVGWPEDWDNHEKSVWVIGLHEFQPWNSGYPEVFFILFKIDVDQGEQPGVCHARQVIIILYTGAADELALAECLEAGTEDD